jgi:NAD(P)-dependent dehydrogenase (short-subunit alcohol dehydrogenase family)
MGEFTGKVAVITGAANGIGRAMAERCVREGMKVVLADIDEADLTAAATELRAAGGTVLDLRTDVANRGDVERLADRAFDAFGQVHLLFNNAGVAAGGAPWEVTWNDWEWVLSVDLWGVIHGVKVFTPLMMAQHTECHIVNTSSGAGLNEPVPLTPEAQAGLAAFEAAIEAATPPARVAGVVFEAIERGQFYILSHPEWLEAIQLRTDTLLRMENPQSPAAILMKLTQPPREKA